MCLGSQKWRLERYLFSNTFFIYDYQINTRLSICISNVDELSYLTDVFYHHRASVWGVKIQDNYLITGSMDKTISLINLQSMIVEKHFIAHEDEWGGKQ